MQRVQEGINPEMLGLEVVGKKYRGGHGREVGSTHADAERAVFKSLTIRM